jgi:hypothetical protein
MWAYVSKKMVKLDSSSHVACAAHLSESGIICAVTNISLPLMKLKVCT